MRNLRLDICYDGTRYRGWQRLKEDDSSLQYKLETALSRILEEPITVSGSGRTDAGVHALHQIVNFHCESDMDESDILAKLRRHLPGDIGIYSCESVSPRFHARLNAKTKTYRYRVWNSTVPCVFDRRYVYVDAEKLDVGAMRDAAKYMVGTHDFRCYCDNRSKAKSTVRTIYSMEIFETDKEVQFFITGNGFLHHMVRILVGTLLEIGHGERKPGDIFGQKRADMGRLVPASGLCLMEVTY